MWLGCQIFTALGDFSLRLGSPQSPCRSGLLPEAGICLRGTSLLSPLLVFCFLVRDSFCSLLLRHLSRLKYMPYCHFAILRIRNKVNRKMALTCYYCNYHSLEEASNCINWPVTVACLFTVVTTVNRHSFRTEMPLVLRLPQWLRW